MGQPARDAPKSRPGIFEDRKHHKMVHSVSEELDDYFALNFIRPGEQACELCKKIDPSRKDVIVHFNLDYLISSAEAGCRVCRFFMKTCSPKSDTRNAVIHINPTEGDLYYRQLSISGGVWTTFQVFMPSRKAAIGAQNIIRPP